MKKKIVTIAFGVMLAVSIFIPRQVMAEGMNDTENYAYIKEGNAKTDATLKEEAVDGVSQLGASETTYTVSGGVNGTYSSLQAAVSACPANGVLCSIAAAGNATIPDTVTIPQGVNIFFTSVASPITVEIENSTNRHFIVKGKLTLKNIIIRGKQGQSPYGIMKLGNGGIYVNGGSLFMESGAVITNCYSNFRREGTAENTVDAAGGGVYVYQGQMQMDDGEIKGNYSAFYGGGVEIDTATFTMNGGNISDNYARASGGGVFVDDYATFEMNGGTITKNSAATVGGGVCLWTDCSFRMSNGVINNNTCEGGQGPDLRGNKNFCSITGGTIGIAYLFKSTPRLQGTSTYQKTYGDGDFNLDMRCTVGDNTLQYQSSAPDIVSVNKDTGRVAIKKAGTATITVKAIESEKYQADNKTVSITVKKAEQKLAGSAAYTKAHGNSAFSLDAKLMQGNGQLSYTSANKKVATVSSRGVVALRGAGKTTVAITAAATTNFNQAKKTVTITVKPKKASLLTVKGKGKNGAVVTWKKDNTVTGYQLQYSTSSTFKKGNKTKLITKNSLVKTTLSKLKGGKKYYVRIREYKNISGKKVYGSWSLVKRIQIR